MKTKKVASGTGSMAKASTCLGKASTSTFTSKGMKAKAASNTMPGKMILD